MKRASTAVTGSARAPTVPKPNRSGEPSRMARYWSAGRVGALGGAKRRLGDLTHPLCGSSMGPSAADPSSPPGPSGKHRIEPPRSRPRSPQRTPRAPPAPPPAPPRAPPHAQANVRGRGVRSRTFPPKPPNELLQILLLHRPIGVFANRALIADEHRLQRLIAHQLPAKPAGHDSSNAFLIRRRSYA